MKKPLIRKPLITYLTALLLLHSAAAYGVPLSEKLSKQWERYDAAQDELLSRIDAPNLSPENKLISRDEWESLLALEGDYAFTSDDLEVLRQIHHERIEAAKAKARRESVISLDALRALPASKSGKAIADFCRAVPKGAMLHIHPSGTLNRNTVERLVKKNDPTIDVTELLAGTENDLYSDEASWLRSIGPKPKFSALSDENQSRFLGFFFLPPGTHLFSRFDAAFWFIDFAVPNWENFYEVFWDFGRRAAAEGVSYIEFTSGIRAETLPNYELIASRYEAEFGITARFNASFYRLSNQEELHRKANALLSVKSPFLVGIDLLGNETNSPALEHGQLVYGTILNAVNKGQSQLHRTMHAGELGDPRNPRDALILGSERLGHGVKLESDPVALEYAATHKVPIETNLVSNIRLRAIDDIKDHPFLHYLRLGLPVSLSTDDEGILETDINTECEVATSTSDVTYAEIKQMALNGIETSFADETTKARLKSKLLGDFEKFEDHWSSSGPSATQ